MWCDVRSCWLLQYVAVMHQASVCQLLNKTETLGYIRKTLTSYKRWQISTISHKKSFYVSYHTGPNVHTGASLKHWIPSQMKSSSCQYIQHTPDLFFFLNMIGFYHITI